MKQTKSVHLSRLWYLTYCVLRVDYDISTAIALSVYTLVKWELDDTLAEYDWYQWTLNHDVASRYPIKSNLETPLA